MGLGILLFYRGIINMKNKTKHIKLLSLLLSIVMIMSTAMVFAEGEAGIDESSDPVLTTEAVEEAPAPEEQAGAASVPEEPVKDQPVAVDPVVTITPSEVNIVEGATQALTAELQNAPEGLAVVWKWTSSNENVAIVSEDGVVTGVAKGTATITAVVEGTDYSSTCSVIVEEKSFTQDAPVLAKTKKYSSKDFEGKNDNGYILNWTQADTLGVTGYQIVRNGKEIVATVGVDVNKYEILVPSGTSKYTVKAIGSSADEFLTSNEISITVSGVITATHAYTWYCTAKKKATIYKKSTGSTKLTTVKKGTKMTAIGRYPSKIKKFKNPKRVQVRLSDGRTGWIKYSYLSGGVKAVVNVKSDYSRSLKEYMVNNAAFSQKTKESSAIRGKVITSGDNHLLWACLYTQRVYTFEKKNGKWSLIHSDRITTGKFSHPTRSSETSGIYTICKKKQGKVWMVQENGKRYYFTHASYITTGISFHTGTWWASGKVRGTAKSNGQPGTYGCIRMYTAGAKYVYSHNALKKTRAIVTRFD